MPGRLEPVRRIFASRYLRGFRDFLVLSVWRLDPELTALGWNVLQIAGSPNRKKAPFAWAKYDDHYRQLRTYLFADGAWRHGPVKSWDLAMGPVRAFQYLRTPISECRGLDFGCGGHFSDSTGLIMYLCGFKSVDSLEIGSTVSGFENGAALDLVHWIQDQLVCDTLLCLPQGLHLDRVRLAELHRLACLPSSSAYPAFSIPVRLLTANLMDHNWKRGQYDLITSNAVLEHVENPPAVWAKLKSILRVGGVMHHVIDFRDHRSYYEPQKYEALPPLQKDEWKDPHTNGWRFENWLNLISEHSEWELIEIKSQATDGTSTPYESTPSHLIAGCELVIRRLM